MTETDNKIYFFPNEENKGMLNFPDYNIKGSAYIGKNGLTIAKKEGDGKTPIGEFNLGVILGMHSKDEIADKIKSRYIQITKDMYWVDDFKSKHYNKLVDISKVKKDWTSAEHLIEYPIQYEYLIEIKTNPKNIPGKGSAIFLHCTNNRPTAGCIAVNRKIMKKIIETIDEQTKIKIGI